MCDKGFWKGFNVELMVNNTLLRDRRMRQFIAIGRDGAVNFSFTEKSLSEELDFDESATKIFESLSGSEALLLVTNGSFQESFQVSIGAADVKWMGVVTAAGAAASILTVVGVMARVLGKRLSK